MQQFTVTLPNEIATKLKSAAQNSGVKPEEFMLAFLEENLARIDPDFINAMKHVLKKNAELYRRLA